MNDLLPLPIAPAQFLQHAVEPALALLPAAMSTDRARLMLVAIALQESGLASRWQIIDPHRPDLKGPARGLLQFERGGGVRGVLMHEASQEYARWVCSMRVVAPTVSAVYAALEHDDVLAAAFGRLLLWTAPRALPAVGDESGAWALYLRCWRPGKPRPEKWAAYYRAAVATVREAGA